MDEYPTPAIRQDKHQSAHPAQNNIDQQTLPPKATGKGMLFYQACCVFFIAAWLIFNALTVYPYESIPDRRKDQFAETSAHLIAPLPYSYPGIGTGFFLLGNFSNIYDTTTDFLALDIVGDAGGYILQLDEAPLIDERLFVQLYYEHIDRAVVNNYNKRGMKGTGENDFTLLDISLSQTKSILFDLTFFDRRLDLFLSYRESEYEIQAIRDHNGHVITALDEPFRGRETNELFGVSVDLTDDYLDPRRGVRFKLTYQDRPAQLANDASYYTLDYNLLLYMPMFKADTLVFNYYQSDAHVSAKGNTNASDIRQELNFNCAPTDTACLQSEQEIVDIIINQRSNGTATSVGGRDRLRSYPQGRFQGGHSAFIGAEYRWNFKQEVAPFNYLFWKDVRTGVQIAFFAEMATVSESRDELWDETRQSYGTGLRLVAKSGAVYRADLAFGDEGTELVVFFFYPWN